ncbi:MAG: hypothetical protein NXI09_07740 [Bacteroidetes bacterium]|nr:hypothetical protein [Bacteroidota bacterium]
MPGINWKYVDDSKSRIYWSIASDYHIYLGQLFIDFDFKFNQSLSENSTEVELSAEQIEFLINGLEKRLDHLLKDYKPNVPRGLTSISNEYRNVKYEFFVRMSRNHRLLNGLIRFHRFLIESKTQNKKIKFWGGKIE